MHNNIERLHHLLFCTQTDFSRMFIYSTPLIKKKKKEKTRGMSHKIMPSLPPFKPCFDILILKTLVTQESIKGLGDLCTKI